MVVVVAPSSKAVAVVAAHWAAEAGMCRFLGQWMFVVPVASPPGRSTVGRVGRN